MALHSFGEIAEQLRHSTVQILSGRHGQGSGFVVKADGVLITNSHVVGNASNLTVGLSDGSSFPARLEKRSSRRDLAVLRISTAGLTPAALGNSDALRVGELVMAVGNPLGFMGAVTTGTVHAVGRRPGLGPTQWIHADVQLAPGNSGGPLADARGHVVGVNTMVADGLGLAIPANMVARLLSGDLEQAPLGVVLKPASVRVAGVQQLGLALVEVDPGGAAEYASLRPGDILTGIGGRVLASLDDLEGALEGSGERVLHVQFIRDDPRKIRTAHLRLGAHRLTTA